MKDQVIDLVGEHREKILELMQERVDMRDPEYARMRDLQDRMDDIDAKLDMHFEDNGKIRFGKGKTKAEMGEIFKSELFGLRMALQQEFLGLLDPDWVKENLR